MKVYIGKYPNYSTYFAESFSKDKIVKYIDAHDKYPTNDEHLVGKDKIIYNILDKIDDVSVYFYKLFSRKERKVKIRIDDYDAWSADVTIAMIVHPLLLKLKDNQHICPKVEDEDLPDYIIETTKDDSDDSKVKRWNWVLNEIIFAFGCLKRDWEDDFYDPDDVYKYDKEGIIKTNDRINNGLRLFAKFYHSLWD